MGEGKVQDLWVDSSIAAASPEGAAVRVERVVLASSLSFQVEFVPEFEGKEFRGEGVRERAVAHFAPSTLQREDIQAPIVSSAGIAPALRLLPVR